MVVDEPAMWNLIPERQRERVMIAAKAMCQSRDVYDDDDWNEGEGRENYCGECDTPAGGTCLAFGLYGQMALSVIEALDRAPNSISDINP